MIKTFPNINAYGAAGVPTTESRVASINEGNEVKIDGVNVEKKVARWCDTIMEDADGNLHIFDRDTFNINRLPVSWTYKGPYMYDYNSEYMAVFNGNFSSLPSFKYADIIQHAITAISSTSITINLKIQDTSMSGDAQYATLIPVAVTLTSAEINATTAAEISAAVAAKATELGDTKAWWAYLADDNYNKVESGGTKIIVQCDTWVHWNQYGSSMSGGTIAFCTWRDMPASDNYWKKTGASTNYRGLMNVDGGMSYWTTSGRTPNANVDVAVAGNDNPVSQAAFTSSEYCAKLREVYGTYRNYLAIEYGIMWPQKKGVFALPDGHKLTAKYGPMMAPTKDGGTKAMFPSLNWAYLQGGGLWDVREGVLMMEDERLAILNATQAKAGKVQISAASYRWFAQRCNVRYAWIFNGTSRTLDGSSVNTSNQAGAVMLLKKP